MDSSHCSLYHSQDECIKQFGADNMQKKLESTMPWVGMYIAAASAACAIAMAANAVNAFRTKRLWFPCKYFSLNAFSLTLLAVAMKLPIDLMTRMSGINDKLSRVSGLVLMSTAMANFMPSLGSMEDNEITLNISALAILVLTIAGNIYTHIIQLRHYYVAKVTFPEKILTTVYIFLLFAVLCSLAVMVPTAKRYIGSQYNQKHNKIVNDEHQANHAGKFTPEELRIKVRRYWMMAVSGSPQFVIARSVTCVVSGLMCLLMALTLLEAHIRLPLVYQHAKRTSSIYKSSINWVLVIQSAGVVMGSIAPLLRWFNAARFKSTKIGHKSFREEFEVEAYWTQRLRDLRESPSPLKTGHHKFRKLAHEAKVLVLNICIGVQILIVWVSKLVLLVSAVFVKGLMFCLRHIKDLQVNDSAESDDLRDYILRLQGEADLPKGTLQNICNEVDKLIQMGRKKQSKNLIKLLQKSLNFNGVRDFDSNEIRSLHSQEPPHCWSLPVVTLTSIAISLPNIMDQKSKQLINAVNEGLYFARLIEKTLDSKRELASIRNAVDVVWVGVELYKKWQDKDLKAAGQTHKEMLQRLSDISEKTVKCFTAGANNFLVQDPLNWPVKVIGSNSMYRITQTILLSYDDDDHHTESDEELFERLSIMISGILAACLTNLARVVSLKCYSSAAKEREKSISQAALLLGESEEILEILQQRELPPALDPEKAATIQGWRELELLTFHDQAFEDCFKLETRLDFMSSLLENLYHTRDECNKYYGVDYVQAKLELAMPWIGMYIAAASAACTMAMAVNAIDAIRTKRLWFPCKYFSLNAFSLTVLAVAMKIPIDITTRMPGINDKLARVSGLVLMSTAMANFVPSLGSMEDSEIMLNLGALGILVITIAGNVFIHIIQLRHFYVARVTFPEKIGCTVSMFLLLAILYSSAVMVPTAKRYIKSQYNQMHNKIAHDEQRANHAGKFTSGELRITVKRYCVMAVTGAPQFVIARSVTCVVSGLMCLLMALTLLEAHIRLPLVYKHARRTSSSYKSSINWILVIQSAGVVLGTIAPLLRWFNAARFKSNKIGHRSFRDELEVEAYWTQRLRDLRESPLPLKTGHHKFRKLAHEAKVLVLNICIGVQILIVRVSKLVLLVSAVFVKGVVFFLWHIKDLQVHDSIESDDLSDYVLRLEGEADLPKSTIQNICNEVDKLIQVGKKKQSKNLIKLLQKSLNFNGVRDFDSNEIRSLHSQEPPRGWSLPVVTLTSIALSLPNITDQKSKQLFNAVKEGLYFARLVEKTLDSKRELASIRNAADVVWVGVELYKKWRDKDLKAAGQTHKEMLQRLSDNSEKTVKCFTTGANNFLVQDPLNWPVKVICANSMYRITQTILLSYDDDHTESGEELFERLSAMISGILAACLTNLARVVSLKCYSSTAKEREKSISQAALLLGESEEILEILQQRELPPALDPEKAASIQGWMELERFMKILPNGGGRRRCWWRKWRPPRRRAEKKMVT